MAAQLEPQVAKLVQDAKIAAAKAAEEARRRVAEAAAAKRAKRSQLLAKGKGGKTKVVVVNVKSGKVAKTNKIEDRVTTGKSGKRKYRLAETSAAKR